MAILGTERSSVHSLGGVIPPSTEGFHPRKDKTDPRDGRSENVSKVLRSEHSLRGETPTRYMDNPPT